MLDSIPDHAERPCTTLETVLRRLRALHAASASERRDEDRISEGMSNQILGTTTMRAHAALFEQESRLLRETAEYEQWSPLQLEEEIARMRQRITADIFKEHWYESTLSTPDYPIHAATYGISMFRYDLRMLMTQHPSTERLEEFAWIMFDVDGLRSFKDCTSHADTTRYLQNIARIFVDPEGPTNRFLRERGIHAIPMATGGDEFELYLRSRSPLTHAFVDEIVVSFQQEVSSSEMLRASLDFKNEEVRIKYGIPTREERKAFARLDCEMRKMGLDAIGMMLPDTHTPSISGGHALLTRGILLAVEKDAHDLQGTETFSSLRDKLVQSTIDTAESTMKKNKEDRWRELEYTDPKRFAFRHRNAENRRLLDLNRALQLRVSQLEKERGNTHTAARILLQEGGEGAKATA